MKNAPALWSVVLGLLATAAVPAAVLYADRSGRVALIWSGVAVPVAFVLGLAGIAAARAGRRRAALSLRGRSGAGTARAGKWLSVLGLLLAGTGTISLVVYALLTLRGRS